jgi:hypothetical protein
MIRASLFASAIRQSVVVQPFLGRLDLGVAGRIKMAEALRRYDANVWPSLRG